MLTPDIFDYIDAVKPGKGGEIQITDALQMRTAAQHAMPGCRVNARRHDVGNALDFIKTNIARISRRRSANSSWRRRRRCEGPVIRSYSADA